MSSLLIGGSIAATGCTDPGAGGLEAVIVAAEDLVAQLARAERESGQPGGPAGRERLDPQALDAWAARVGPALLAIVREDARALGPTRREELARRWARARAALIERLEVAPPAPPPR